jgi:CRISPR-associated protein Cst2
LRGGAKKALHYGDRTPALILLAPLKGGVNPFTRILGARDGKPVFLPDVLREELDAWQDEVDGGPVLLGWAPGFLGDQRDQARRELADLIDDGRLLLDHPRVLINDLAGQIERGERDDWFQDATE